MNTPFNDPTPERDPSLELSGTPELPADPESDERAKAALDAAVDRLLGRIAKEPQYPTQQKTLFVDLETKTTRYGYTPREVVETFLEGRGGNMFYLYNLLDPTVEGGPLVACRPDHLRQRLADRASFRRPRAATSRAGRPNRTSSWTATAATTSRRS